MIKWMLSLFDNSQEEYEKRLLAFAKREYPRDWEHAFYMLLANKQPFSE